MPLPKGYVARQGDVLLAKCTVYYDQVNPDEEVIGVRFGAGAITQFLDSSQFSGIDGYHFECGDRISVDGHGPGAILSLTNTHAWVSFDSCPNQPKTISRAIINREPPKFEEVA